MNIFKYILSEIETTIRLPKGAVVLHVAEQNKQLTLWVELDPCLLKYSRTFVVKMTGETFDKDNLEFIGTVLAVRGLVFHVYEKKSL